MRHTLQIAGLFSVLGIIIASLSPWHWWTENLGLSGIYAYGLIVNLFTSFVIVIIYGNAAEIWRYLKGRPFQYLAWYLVATGVVCAIMFIPYAIGVASYLYSSDIIPEWGYMLIGTIPHVFCAAALTLWIYSMSRNAYEKQNRVA